MSKVIIALLILIFSFVFLLLVWIIVLTLALLLYSKNGKEGNQPSSGNKGGLNKRVLSIEL